MDLSSKHVLSSCLDQATQIMGSPIAGDEHFLLITLIVTVVYQLSFFVVAFSCKFDKVSEAKSCWGLGAGILLPFRVPKLLTQFLVFRT